MKQNWFSFAVIFVSLVMLIFLASLQYKWIGQISDSERVRLNGRLHDDAGRFSEEFNREMQAIYFGFQIDGRNFAEKNWTSFNKRFNFWKAQARYPGVVKNIFLIKNDRDPAPLKFDSSQGTFKPVVLTGQLGVLVEGIDQAGEITPVREIENSKKIENKVGGDKANTRGLVLVMPISKTDHAVEEIFIKDEGVQRDRITKRTRFEAAERIGILVVELDDKIVTNQMLPDLVNKYFSIGESGEFRISIENEKNLNVFHTGAETVSKPDVTSRFFSLNTNNFAFFSEKVGNSIIDTQLRKTSKDVSPKTLTFGQQRVEMGKEVVNVELEKKPDVGLIKLKKHPADGIWTLRVQHSDGSLEEFLSKTRYRNLGVSFGILALLGVSMVLILIASQRVRAAAQRQLDFVSSVSHEFRTPLSVIYSAGENLSDGVVGDKERIASYGTLIKREGKKLSGMVEQILEFAGAKSGNRKFDFQPVALTRVLHTAIGECRPVATEYGIDILREIPEDLSPVVGDENALVQALQNLIHNSLKYSGGSKSIDISAANIDGGVRITIEDQGVGISNSDLKNIFEPFYRAQEVVDRQISGNGLGLSLVRQIVDAHGGRIDVKSETGKGSTFTVELPAIR